MGLAPRLTQLLAGITLLQVATNLHSYLDLLGTSNDDRLRESRQELPPIDTSQEQPPIDLGNIRDRIFDMTHSLPLQPRRYGNPNITKRPSKYPRSGARDENKNWGYVHDPTILRQKPQDFLVNPEEREEVCAKVGYGPEGGGKRAARQLFEEQLQLPELNKATIAMMSSVKVFCGVYTHPGSNNLTDAIRMTWGRRCDGIMFASTETRHDAATINLPHYGGFMGLYRGVWQKVRSMIGYIYDNFLEDYDYFFLSGDDTYVIIENLKSFLTSQRFIEETGGKNTSVPLYAGSWTHPKYLSEVYGEDFFYNGGGSGYVLNRAAIRALVEKVFPVCHNTTDMSAEDLYMGVCLKAVLNVTGHDTRDLEGRERFFGVDPVLRAALRRRKRGEPIFGEQYKVYLRSQLRWQQRRFGWSPIYGVEAISPQSISFHLVKPAVKMKRYERLIYRMPHYKELDCGIQATTR
ncbi:MAG: hypothetical protein SGILL_000947 [Bacillariaceae sp.]